MVPVPLKILTFSVIIFLSYGGLRYDIEYMIPIIICVIEVELYEREETNLLVFILQLNRTEPLIIKATNPRCATNNSLVGCY